MDLFNIVVWTLDKEPYTSVFIPWTVILDTWTWLSSLVTKYGSWWHFSPDPHCKGPDEIILEMHFEAYENKTLMATCCYISLRAFLKTTLWCGWEVTRPGNCVHGAGLWASLRHSILALKVRNLDEIILRVCPTLLCEALFLKTAYRH